MRAAGPTANEEQRLATLHALGILDTPTEARFDAITHAAAELLRVPVSLISLVDTRRQWFKSHYGLETRETPRDISFCAHAILEPELFVVPDAEKDERFHDNTLVTDDPHIRFYAGCPLSATNGERLGTLCLIDRRPRELSAEQRKLLAHLGRWAEAELNLHAEHESVTRFVEHLLQQISEPVVLAGADERVVFANAAAERVLRYKPGTLRGLPLAELVAPAERRNFAAELAALGRSHAAFGTLERGATMRMRNDDDLMVMLGLYRCKVAGRDITALFLRPR